MGVEKEAETGGSIDRYQRDEPALLDTRIPDFTGDPKLYAQLVLKLKEYEAREARWAAVHPELRVLQQGENAYLALFKRDILDAILTLSQERDMQKPPIDILEVVGQLMAEHPSYSDELAAAAIVPFVRNDRSVTGYEPDFVALKAKSLEAKEENRPAVALAFGLAYSVITQYAGNGAALLTTGHGLPEIDA